MSFRPDALIGKNITHPNRTGYRVEKMLGQGAFGTTYQVRSLSNNHEYALKALNVVQTQKELFDFFQEALTLAQLKHPNIVAFKEFGRDPQEDVTFIVMFLANNGSLGSRRMPLGVEYAVRYSFQAALGLQRAHDNNITHRDVKRDNLLLHKHPNNPHLDVLVTDFGIALVTHSFDRLQKQDAIGSLDYMAPEHIQGKATEKSDQYSLAVVTFEELTGRPPYEGTDADVLRGHLYENIPTLTQKGVTMTDVLKAVEPVVRRGLAKEPHNRYPRIQDFGDDLVNKLQEAIDASPKKPSILFVMQGLMQPPVIGPNNQQQVQPSASPDKLTQAQSKMELALTRLERDTLLEQEGYRKNRVQIHVLYASKDLKFVDSFMKQLNTLIRDGFIELTISREDKNSRGGLTTHKISPAEEGRRIQESDIVLLLMDAESLDDDHVSNTIRDVIIPVRNANNQKYGENKWFKFIPIRLKEAQIPTWLGKLSTIPPVDRPAIGSASHREDALYQASLSVRKVVKETMKDKNLAGDPPQF